jgi:hypothetical protein
LCRLRVRGRRVSGADPAFRTSPSWHSPCTCSAASSAGLDFLALGDTTKLANVDADGEQKDSKVVFLVGIGVTY